MQIQVRRAALQDIDWLIGQLRSFSEFFGSHRPLFGDEAYARKTLEAFVQNHLVLIADQEGSGPVGFIAGLITPHLFNPSIRVLAETFWWVDESHRGSRAGLMLLNEFISFGKENADWITVALEEKSAVRDETLLKRGFRLQEKSFLLEVE